MNSFLIICLTVFSIVFQKFQMLLKFNILINYQGINIYSLLLRYLLFFRYWIIKYSLCLFIWKLFCMIETVKCRISFNEKLIYELAKSAYYSVKTNQICTNKKFEYTEIYYEMKTIFKRKIINMNSIIKYNIFKDITVLFQRYVLFDR